MVARDPFFENLQALMVETGFYFHRNSTLTTVMSFSAVQDSNEMRKFDSMDSLNIFFQKMEL